MGLFLLSVIVADRPALLVALATTGSPADPISLLVTYGPLGIFLVLLATGQFRTKYEVQRLEKQIGEQAAEINRLHEEARQKDELNRAFQMQLTGHALPALAQSARVFEAIPNTESDALDEVRRLQEELAKQIASLKQREQP